MAVEPVVVDESQLTPLESKLSESAEETLISLASDDINLEFTDDAAAEQIDEAAGMEVDDAPVVRFIQKMLLDAINEGVSDIYFEPYEKSYRIRFRTDGILLLSSRIKLLLASRSFPVLTLPKNASLKTGG